MFFFASNEKIKIAATSGYQLVIGNVKKLSSGHNSTEDHNLFLRNCEINGSQNVHI